MTIPGSGVQIQYHNGNGYDLKSRQRVIYDETRSISFTGVRLASISSERDDRPRWTVISLYRTDGNMYIAHRIGVSTVVHDITCAQVAGKRLPGPEGIHEEEAPVEERTPCPVCRPDIARAMSTDPQSLRVEIDRHWTVLNAEPENIYRELFTTRNGVKSLSYLATSLLVNAAEHDPGISALVENHSLTL